MTDHITVIGNIATTPERRTTSGGVPVINFRLASSQRYFDNRTGKWNDGETNWYSISAYRQLAEHALASLRLGERVIVTGKFRLRSWESGKGKGMDAEIDAVGLGHDLLWGTSAYRRDRDAANDATGRTEGEATADVEAMRPGGSDESSDPALVGAGAPWPDAPRADEWARPGDADSTPF